MLLSERVQRSFRKGDIHLVKQINTSLVIKTVAGSGPLSRASIAKVTNLNRATACSIIEDLEKSGWVVPCGMDKVSSRGGRTGTLYKLNERGKYAVGVDFDGEKVSVAVVNLGLKKLAGAEGTVPADGNANAVLKKLVEVIKRAFGDIKDKNYDILGIGLGLTGILDKARERSLSISHIADWDDVPLKNILEDKFDVPVALDINSSTMALGEKWFGAASAYEDFICVGLGRGVGMGIFLNGKPYRGADCSSGECGHMIIDMNGSECYCGSRGCLETLVSSAIIVNSAKEAVRKGSAPFLASQIDKDNSPDVPLVIRSAVEGDPGCIEILRRSAEYMGIAVSNTVNILDPSAVIISGSLAPAGNIVLEPIKRKLEENALPHYDRQIDICVSTLADEAKTMGAAALILEKVFNTPPV